MRLCVNIKAQYLFSCSQVIISRKCYWLIPCWINRRGCDYIMCWADNEVGWTFAKLWRRQSKDQEINKVFSSNLSCSYHESQQATSQLRCHLIQQVRQHRVLTELTWVESQRDRPCWASVPTRDDEHRCMNPFLWSVQVWTSPTQTALQLKDAASVMFVVVGVLCNLLMINRKDGAAPNHPN